MIWLVVAYAVGIIALGIALGQRIKQVRTAQEQLDAMDRRRIGLSE